MNVKIGDKVKVLTGKDKGKEGAVTKVLRKEDKVVVEGLNLYKRHLKNKGQGGSIVEFAAPMHISNISVISSAASKTSASKKTTVKKSAPKKTTKKTDKK